MSRRACALSVLREASANSEDSSHERAPAACLGPGVPARHSPRHHPNTTTQTVRLVRH